MTRKDSLKGFTVNDLLDINPDAFNNMNRGELAKVVSRLASAANKRIKRVGEYMDKRGVNYKAGTIAKSDKFSVKGKGINQLRAEYARIRDFMERKTSTVKGIKKVEKDFIARVSDRLGYTPEDFTSDQLSRFWHAYKRADEMGLFTGIAPSSDIAQKITFQSWANTPNVSVDDFIDRFSDEIDKEYEETIEDDEYDVSSFFEV